MHIRTTVAAWLLVAYCVAAKKLSVDFKFEGEDCVAIVNTVRGVVEGENQWNVWPSSVCKANDDSKGPGENQACIRGKCACWKTDDYSPNATAVLCSEPRCAVLTTVIQARKECLLDNVEEKATKEIAACIIGSDFKDCQPNPPPTERFRARGQKLSQLKVRGGTLQASDREDKVEGNDGDGTGEGTGTSNEEEEEGNGDEGWRYVTHYSFCSKDYGAEKREAFAAFRAMAFDLKKNLIFWANPANKGDDTLPDYTPCKTKDEYEKGAEIVLNWLEPKLTNEICTDTTDCDDEVTPLKRQLANFAYTLDYPLVDLDSLANNTFFSG